MPTMTAQDCAHPDFWPARIVVFDEQAARMRRPSDPVTDSLQLPVGR